VSLLNPFFSKTKTPWVEAHGVQSTKTIDSGGLHPLIAKIESKAKRTINNHSPFAPFDKLSLIVFIVWTLYGKYAICQG